MAEGLSEQEVERAKGVFDIYGSLQMDGILKVDATRLGDLLRAIELSPTLKTISNLGGTTRRGEKLLTFEEFLKIIPDAKKDTDKGNIHDYVEIIKLYDKDGNGYISYNQLMHLLLGYGERLEKDEVIEIMGECCDPCDDDGFTKWMPFLERIMEGPPEPPTLAAMANTKSREGNRAMCEPTAVDVDAISRVPSADYSPPKSKSGSQKSQKSEGQASAVEEEPAPEPQPEAAA